MNKQLIKKGTLLQSEGDTKPKAFIVKQGLLRSYVIDEKGCNERSS